MAARLAQIIEPGSAYVSRTLKAMGPSIPPSILVRADRVIK
jgi:hypothetical protein